MSGPVLRYTLLSLSVLLLAGCKVEVFVTGGGEVTSTDPAVAQCDSAPACFDVPRGNTVTLQASPREGFVFAGWGGACEDAMGEQCTLQVSGGTRVQATFHGVGESGAPKPLMQPGTEYYFTAPWPNDAYSLDSDGTIDADRFPLPARGKLDSQIRKLAANQTGFATNGGVYFQFDRADVVEIWRDESERFSAANPEPRQAFFLNIDIDSPAYGQWTPAVVRPYFNSRGDGGLSQQAMLLVSVAPGFPLLPATRYAAVMLTTMIGDELLGAGLDPADAIAQLEGEWSPRLGYSETLFNELAAQKGQVDAALTLSGVADPENLAAFSVFTTQDPLQLDRQVGASVKAFTDEQIVDSVKGLSLVAACGQWDDLSHYVLETDMPVYMTGGPLPLLSGGSIKIVDGAAVVQGEQRLELLLSVPCDAPAEGRSLALITHALGTGESWDWFDDFYLQLTPYRLDRNAIHVTLNAPLTAERRPSTFDDLDALFPGIGETLSAAGIVLADFNFINLEATRSQHVQYGAELFYASRVSGLLPAILEKLDVDRNVPEWAYREPALSTLSGLSLGGLAVMHALAQGAEADVVTTYMTPRPNFIHLDNILSFTDTLGDYGYPELGGLIESYTGVVSDDLAQPLLLWVQNVLEPIDIANHAGLLAGKPFMWSVDSYSDELHGGDAGYSMMTAIQRLNPGTVGVIDDAWVYDQVYMRDWVDGDIHTLYNIDNVHEYGRQFVNVTNGGGYQAAACFPAALAAFPDSFGPALQHAVQSYGAAGCRFE